MGDSLSYLDNLLVIYNIKYEITKINIRYMKTDNVPLLRTNHKRRKNYLGY